VGENILLRALRRPIGFFDGIADRVFSVAGAVALSQFPQFYGQYMQRLGGHLDEARLMLQLYIDAASTLNLSLEEYIREHLDATSEVFTSTGEIIQRLLERVQMLESSYQALENANVFNRWFVFLNEVDWTIAAGTWDNFVPGIPTTLEGLSYALAGLLIGWGCYSLLKYLLLIPIRLFRPTKRKGKS
jgi:hypothetical protein